MMSKTQSKKPLTEREGLFRGLFQAYKDRHSTKSAQECQDDCNNLWKTFKDDFVELRKYIDRIKVETRHRKASNTLNMFFKAPIAKKTKTNENPWQSETSSSSESKNVQTSVDGIEVTYENSNSDQTLNNSPVNDIALVEENKECPKPNCPKQDELEMKISEVSKKMAALAQSKAYRGCWNDEEKAIQKQCLKDKEGFDKELKKRKQWARSQHRKREKQKNKLKELVAANPGINEALARKAFRTSVGRPALVIEQEGLQMAIIDLVTASCAADGKRRTEALSCCATLKDLHKGLLDRGFKLSKTSTYYRLLPARSNSRDAINHTYTVPVRLLKPENSLRKKHIDSHFAMATVKMLKELAGFLGKGAVFFLSQDDKARVPIGMQAANKQSALCMHIQYKVRLPDHNWVVAPKHKLIPSVYAACAIDKNKVTYSGPTFVAVSSAKHSSSTATTHSDDFETIGTLPEFDEICKTTEGKFKPILVVTVDGGPDENPRFPKTCVAWSKHFVDHDFDCIFVATHAPGHSAFNAVERRMAPLTHQLSGVLLPHDFYGTHLDGSGKTIDEELEMRNFEKAGTSLADLFSKRVIDGYPVISNFVGSISSAGGNSPTNLWLYKHVRQSQYLLQIVKCNDSNCCQSWRSNYQQIFPDRFLPSPILFSQTEKGVVPVSKDNLGTGKIGGLFYQLAMRKFESQLAPANALPFDFYCPSVQKTLTSKICRLCGIYFPTQAGTRKHLQSKVCQTSETPEQPTFERQDETLENEEDDEEYDDVIYGIDQSGKLITEELEPDLNSEDEVEY